MFQRRLFYILASSENLVLKFIPIAAGQNVWRGSNFFFPKADHFWSFCAFWSLTKRFLTILDRVFLEFFTLAQLSFTTNEMKLCYYHQKVDM